MIIMIITIIIIIIIIIIKIITIPKTSHFSLSYLKIFENFPEFAECFLNMFSKMFYRQQNLLHIFNIPQNFHEIFKNFYQKVIFFNPRTTDSKSYCNGFKIVKKIFAHFLKFYKIFLTSKSSGNSHKIHLFLKNV